MTTKEGKRKNQDAMDVGRTTICVVLIMTCTETGNPPGDGRQHCGNPVDKEEILAGFPRI